MKKLLENKVAIVTGGSYGIGKSISELFSEEGASLVLTARGKKSLDEQVEHINASGGKAIGIVADSGKSEDVNKVIAKTLDTYGKLDVLVNNAGMGDSIVVEDTDDELFEEVWRINLKGPFMYCREALKIMMPRNEGSIVNVSSVMGVRPMGGVSYTSAKGGLNMMTKNIAIRLVGTGIRINSLCPGFTVTPASTHQETRGGFRPDRLKDAKTMVPILHERTVRTVPTQAENQAQVALFLASDMSKAVTGQIIVVDNGQYL